MVAFPATFFFNGEIMTVDIHVIVLALHLKLVIRLVAAHILILIVPVPYSFIFCSIRFCSIRIITKKEKRSLNCTASKRTPHDERLLTNLLTFVFPSLHQVIYLT